MIPADVQEMMKSKVSGEENYIVGFSFRVFIVHVIDFVMYKFISDHNVVWCAVAIRGKNPDLAMKLINEP